MTRSTDSSKHSKKHEPEVNLDPVWMNLANSAIIEPPKLVSFRHPPMETDNVGNRLDGIVATRIENSDGIWRRTDMEDRMLHTHDDIETISKNIAYGKHIRDLEFETREVFEREMLNKNI